MDLENLFRDFVDYAELKERVARLEERDRLRERDEEYRTRSGSWNVEAILAAQRSKKASSIPPSLQVLNEVLNSAWAKVGAILAAGALGWLAAAWQTVQHAGH